MKGLFHSEEPAFETFLSLTFMKHLSPKGKNLSGIQFLWISGQVLIHFSVSGMD